MPRHPMLLALLASIVLALGCPDEPDDDDTGDDDAGDDDTGDDDTGDDDTVDTPVPPCSGETWGLIDETQVDLAVHVRADGDDGGDGTEEAPLATLEAALALTRARDATERRIALGPGTYPASLELGPDDPKGVGDHGLVIEGCSAGEVAIEAADGGEPVLRATGAQDLELRGVTLEGGRRTLWYWGNATATVEAVVVDGGARQGILIEGSDTILPHEPTTTVDLIDVEVRDISLESGPDGDFGFGLYVANADVAMVGGGVQGAAAIGIFAHQSELQLDGVTVESTAADSSGYLGRGIHVQELSEAVLEDVRVESNADAGLFSLRSLWIELINLDVDGTLASDLPGETEQSGDGIVLSAGDPGGLPPDPKQLICTLTDNTVTGSARSGILIEGVSATLQGNTAGADNGLSVNKTAILVQGDSIVTGGDAWEAPPSVLPVFRDDIATDDLTD